MKILGSSVVLLVLLVLGTVAVAAFLGHKIIEHQEKTDRTMEMVVSNLRIINEQTVVREIVDEKLPQISADQRARIAFEIYDRCRARAYPIHYALAIPTHESQWDPKAVSPCGAIGLFQVMPSTAIAYFKLRSIPFTMDKLRDPVMNTQIGLEIAMDYQDAAVISGKSNVDDYVQGMWLYCGKGESYARGVLADSVVYKKRLDAPLQGKVGVLPAADKVLANS